MSPKSRGALLLTAGALLFLIALTADPLGLGSAPGFGWKQIAAALAGVILAAVGLQRLRA